MENRKPSEIEQLFDKAEIYAKTSAELVKLQVIDKTADVVSSVTALIVLGSMVTLFTLFVNVALGLYLGRLLHEYYLGFLIVSGFYLFVAIIIYFLKDRLIKTSISNLVISKLLKEKLVS